MIYLELFLSFLQVGLFSIGGGYAAIPIIQSQVVEKYAWLSLNEFTDLITIAEMTPGPIAVNSATFVGIKIAGIQGAIIATLAVILPSLFIVSLLANSLANIYFKYRNIDFMQKILSTLRPVIVALIASAGLSILLNVLFSGNISIDNLNIIALILFILCFITIRKSKINPVLAMLITGIIYTIINLVL